MIYIFIIGIYILVTIILFGIDFYFYLVNRYCRFHIGRWSNQKKWEDAIEKKAIRWIKKTPTVKITDNTRYILLDMIEGKYKSHSIQSWQKGALILGLEDKKIINDAINRLIDTNGNFIRNPVAIDSGLLSYAILKNSELNEVKPAMDYVVNLILNNIGDDGMIIYTNDINSDERYVDTIGLTCPFLACYGKIYHKPEISKIAVNQLKLFSEYGLERKSLLPNHAFSSQTKLPLGVYGWGRGVAWYVIGLIDTYFEIENNEDKTWILNQIHKVADKYKVYQRQDGGFGYIIQMKNGYDSSVTAVMSYFYLKCYQLFNIEEYKLIYEKCLKKIITVTRITGAIDWCQGDTKGIGVFAQTYDIMPFAQGFCLRTLKER